MSYISFTTSSEIEVKRISFLSPTTIVTVIKEAAKETQDTVYFSVFHEENYSCIEGTSGTWRREEVADDV